MFNFINAELDRYFSRRMSRYFPLSMVGLMVVVFGLIEIVTLLDDGTQEIDFAFDFMQPAEPGIGSFSLISWLIPLVGFVLGASYVGADIKTGVLENILTWFPNRFKFILGRNIAGIIGSFATGVVLAVTYVGLALIFFVINGEIGDMTGGMWADLAAAIGRTGIVVSVFFVIGYAITTLCNSSLASIITYFVNWILFETVLNIVYPRPLPYTANVNASSFITGRYVRQIKLSPFQDGSQIPLDHHSYHWSFVYLAVWAFLFAVPAAILFSRKDVT